MNWGEYMAVTPSQTRLLQSLAPVVPPAAIVTDRDLRTRLIAAARSVEGVENVSVRDVARKRGWASSPAVSDLR